MKASTLIWRRRRLVAFLRGQEGPRSPEAIWSLWASRVYPESARIAELDADLALLEGWGYVRRTTEGWEYLATPPEEEAKESGRLPAWATDPTPFQEAMLTAAADGTPWPTVAKRFGYTRQATSDAVRRLYLWRAEEEPTPAECLEASPAYQRWASAGAVACGICGMPIRFESGYSQKQTCRGCERVRYNERMRHYLRDWRIRRQEETPCLK